MSDEIQPALTQEEWSERLRMPEWASWVLSSRAQHMALANHALPDGHPLKITHEDLYWLGQACDYAERFGYNNPYSGAYEAVDKARALRDRLLALLPPKEDA